MRRASISSSMTMTAGASDVRRLLAIVWNALPSRALRDGSETIFCNVVATTYGCFGSYSPRAIRYNCGVRHLEERVGSHVTPSVIFPRILERARMQRAAVRFAPSPATAGGPATARGTAT